MAALSAYQVCGTAPEPEYDELAALAARVAGSQFALVTLLDGDTQWGKAAYGRPQGALCGRFEGACAHVVLDPSGPLMVNDFASDRRFDDSVMLERGIRSYLGVPLVNAEGFALGALCVLDCTPRDFTPEIVDTIQTLARAVTANLELRRALLQARDAAGTDALTGLANRRSALEAVARLEREQRPFATLVIDLDFFKETNDRHGHAAGDAVLQVTADRLRHLVRPGDLAARLGGDEFLLVLCEVIDMSAAAAVAERVSQQLQAPVAFGGALHRSGATVGVALSSPGAWNGGQAIREADEALMRSKRERRGSIGLAGPGASCQRMGAVVSAFDAACRSSDGITGAGFDLQPVVPIEGNGRAPPAVAFAAVARWTHESLGTVASGELARIVGQTLADRLLAGVRREAVRAFRDVKHAGMAGARLALPLPAREVLRPDLAELADEIEREGLSLRAVEFDLASDLMLHQIGDATISELVALRERGVRLVLEGFGSGDAGLVQLLRLPLDGLKLDPELIRRLVSDRQASEIVRATISLGHTIGLQVAAAGVETHQQLAILRRLGCDAAQGKLVCDALDPANICDWLDRQPACSAMDGARGSAERSVVVEQMAG